jgi:8-oxo-dGTP pyrophosphatase MutT (NUDIX family)
MDKKLSRSISWRNLESSAVSAVGVCFYSVDTHRYLYLLRNDPRHPDTWGLPGGKVNENETLIQAIERECVEEMGFMPHYLKLAPVEKFTSSDGKFFYHTFFCSVQSEFSPVLNDEHTGWAWINSGSHPKPMHPGLWSTVNFEAVKNKIIAMESNYMSA